MYKTIIALITASIFITACGDAKPTAAQIQQQAVIAQAAAANAAVAANERLERESRELEVAKGTARDNAKTNADLWRSEQSALIGNVSIIGNGDSTQSLACPMGDGWASLKVIPKSATVYSIKCSTYSAGTQCLTDEEFKGKAFAGEDGKCGRGRIPYPLKKLGE